MHHHCPTDMEMILSTHLESVLLDIILFLYHNCPSDMEMISSTHLESVLFSKRVRQLHNLTPCFIPSMLLCKVPGVYQGLFQVHPPRRLEKMMDGFIQRDFFAFAVRDFGVEIEIAAPQGGIEKSTGSNS